MSQLENNIAVVTGPLLHLAEVASSAHRTCLEQLEWRPATTVQAPVRVHHCPWPGSVDRRQERPVQWLAVVVYAVVSSRGEH